jgi:hypothetical protein
VSHSRSFSVGFVSSFFCCKESGLFKNVYKKLKIQRPGVRMNSSLRKQSIEERKDFRVIVLGFIVVAVTGIFLFLMLASPILAMRILTSSNKQIASYTKKSIDIAAGVAMKTVNMSGSIVRGTVDRTMQLVSLASDATMDAIQMVADSIMYVVDVVPPITGMVVKNSDEFIKLIILCNSTITGFMAEFLDSGIGGVMNIVNQGFELLGSIGEFTTFLVSNAFIPATQALTGINEIVTAAVETLSNSYLPRLLSAMQFLAQTSNGQLIGDVRITIISTVVGLFVKIFKRVVGIFTGSDIINTIISSVTGVLRSISLSVGGSFDFCGTLLSIIEPALNLLNFIPGLSTINKCVPDFIRLGLWWITQGSFCSSKNPITGFTDCLFGELGSVTIIPAFEINISIESLARTSLGFLTKFPGFGSLIDKFNSLLAGIPKFRLGWTNISLNSILSNLQGVLLFLFTDLKTIFRKEAGGSLVSFSPSLGTLLLPQVLLFVLVKVGTEFLKQFLTLMYGENGIFKRAMKIIDKWVGCVSLKICIPGTSTCWEPELCISTIIGPVVTLYNMILQTVLNQLNTLFDLGDILVRLLGVSTPNINSATLESAVRRALGALLSRVDLPFYINT